MTIKFFELAIFASVIIQSGLSALHIVAFTHRTLSVNEIGRLHIETDSQQDRLDSLRSKFQLGELMFLSTCNRVEFTFTTNNRVDEAFLIPFFHELYPELSEEEVTQFANNCEVYNGLDAIEHQLIVASSVDSMIIGEREIITQVRGAYEACRKMNLTGDLIPFVQVQMRILQ